MNIPFDLPIEEWTDQQLKARLNQLPDAIGKLYSRGRARPDTLGRFRGIDMELTLIADEIKRRLREAAD